MSKKVRFRGLGARKNGTSVRVGTTGSTTARRWMTLNDWLCTKIGVAETSIEPPGCCGKQLKSAFLEVRLFKTVSRKDLCEASQKGMTPATMELVPLFCTFAVRSLLERV